MSATDTYHSFFSQLTMSTPLAALSFFLLGLMRIAPIISLLPFFGTRVPSPVKMGLLIALTFVLLPQIALTSKTLIAFDLYFTLLCLKELFIGFILAFFASAPFYMAESAGIIIDFQRGSSALQVTDPSTQDQTSSIGILYNYILIVLFYQINGPFYFFSALFDSYAIVPIDSWLPSLFFSFSHPFWQSIWSVVGAIFSVGIQLAAPAILAILMTEMFLGIANRLAPQVQIVFLGMSLKSLVGLAILCAAWFFIIQQLSKISLLWLQNLNKLVHNMQF